MISATISNVVIVLTSFENVVITQGYPTLATVGDRVAGEAKGLEYTTVLVDNYGSRAAWIGGQTPQVQWPSGKRQGESLDIVKALEPWIHWVVEKRQKQGVYEQKTSGEKTNGRVGGMYIADCF